MTECPECSRLRTQLTMAEAARDSAREASNNDLFARREMAEKLRRAERAAAFAKSVIMSGERWTDACEDIIGGVLKG